MSKSDELRRVYAVEAESLIDQIATAIESLIAAPQSEAERQSLVETIQRAAHNLKGGAAAAGYGAVERFFHLLEDAMLLVQRSGAEVPAQLLGLILEGLELCQRVIEGRIEEEQHLEVLVERFRSETEITTTAPGRAGVETPMLEQAHDAAAQVEAMGSGRGIRVDVQRLDRLMNFASELSIAHARRVGLQEEITSLLREAQQSEGDAATTLACLRQALGAWSSRSDDDLRSFGRLATELNDAMKQVRMRPLRESAPGWRRIVRTAATECGKSVGLQVAVGTIELDRYVLDNLQDPLMHLLRNAVDHGIEPAGEREKAGKPLRGKILLEAQVAGSMVELDISDDGKGFDVAAIQQACVSRGLASADQVESWDEARLLSSIFTSGFSTAKEVTSLSGRGVGLDVVRAQVEALGGHAQVVAPRLSGGATIRLAVPMSVLSTHGLLVRSGDTTCALSTDTIERTLRVPRRQLQTVNGALAIEQEGGAPLVVVWLSDFLGGKPDDWADVLSLLVLRRGSERLGMVVGQIDEVREYVVLPLTWSLRGAPGISGLVVQADGSLALALDPAHLFELPRNGGMQPTAPEGKGRPLGVRKRVLVVDDSLASRMLGRNMLEAAGFEVMVAANGEEAWHIVVESELDLVVSDIQMPEMDGYELTRKIRSDPRLRDLPVILVTGLPRSDVKAAAAACGADELVIKGTFDQQELLELVAKVL